MEAESKRGMEGDLKSRLFRVLQKVLHWSWLLWIYSFLAIIFQKVVHV